MSEPQTEELNTNNPSTPSPVPQNITYITNVDAGQQNTNRMVSHRRTISIVSQSTISADVFLTPKSIRHEDFVKQSWMEDGHKRSASASSFFSVVSEKDKKKYSLEDNNMKTVVVDVRNGYTQHGFVNATEAGYGYHKPVIKDATTCEQYWACKNLSSREKIFILTIVVLTVIILVLLSVVLYLCYNHGSDKNNSGILSQLIPKHTTSALR